MQLVILSHFYDLIRVSYLPYQFQRTTPQGMPLRDRTGFARSLYECPQPQFLQRTLQHIVSIAFIFNFFLQFIALFRDRFPFKSWRLHDNVFKKTWKWHTAIFSQASWRFWGYFRRVYPFIGHLVLCSCSSVFMSAFLRGFIAASVIFLCVLLMPYVPRVFSYLTRNALLLVWFT